MPFNRPGQSALDSQERARRERELVRRLIETTDPLRVLLFGSMTWFV